MSEINEKSHLQRYIEKMDKEWTEFYRERDQCKNCVDGDMTIKSTVCTFHLEKGKNLIKRTAASNGKIDL